MKMKIEVFIKWVQRWKFLIALFLGAFVTWVFSAIIEIIPEDYKIYGTVLFIGTILTLASIFVVADIFYKYREIKIAKSFFSPFTLQKWETTVTILKEDGSAKVQSIRVLTAEEGVEIPSIRFGFSSDSDGKDIELTDIKVNKKEVAISPRNTTTKTCMQNKQVIKNLDINVPTLNKVSPSIDLSCDLNYPPGAFKKCFNDKEDDIFSMNSFHPTRLLKLNLKLSKELVNAGYRFGQPSFEISDFHGNNVGRIEEMIKRVRAYPEISSDVISWSLTNPKVGLDYRLKFNIFKHPKTKTST